MKNRFEVVYEQGIMLNVQRILFDRETGVHYLQASFGNAGGLTPLLGADGKPVISPLDTYNFDE